MRRALALLVVVVAACADPSEDEPPDLGGPGSSDGGSETDSTGSTDSTDSTDSTGSTDSTDSTGSTGSTDSTGSTGSTDSTGSTGSTDSTDSTDSGTTPEPVTTEIAAFDDLQLGDADPDGCADLFAAGTGQPPRVELYLGDCVGGFSALADTLELASFSRFVLADLDGDGRVDLVTSGSGAPPRLETYLLDELDGVSVGPTTEVFTHDRLWAADIDGDGRDELLTHQGDGVPSTIHVWSGPGDGSLELLASSEVGTFDLGAVGPLDDDGAMDFLAGLSAAPSVNAWIAADGGFVSGPVSWPFTFSKLVLADVDGTGVADLLTDVPGNDWRVSIYTNLGDGAFADAPVDLPLVSYWLLRAADIDGDGDGEVVLAPTGAPPRVMVAFPG